MRRARWARSRRSWAERNSRSAGQHRQQIDPQLQRVRWDAHPRGNVASGCTPARPHLPAGLRRPAQGRLRREPGRDLRPGQYFGAEGHRRAQRLGQRDGRQAGSPRLRSNCRSCTTTATESVIGVWSTASLPPNRVGSNSAAPYVQVSRLGMPLVLPPGAGKPGSANLTYSDGVPVQDSQFDSHFPFLATPLPGSPNGMNVDPSGDGFRVLCASGSTATTHFRTNLLLRLREVRRWRRG